MPKVDETYQSKGHMLFRLDDDFKLAYQTITVDDMMNQYPEEFRDELKQSIVDTLTHPMYSLMEGKEFLDDVRNNCIIDNDGILSDIFVDGFCTNLGLHEAGLSHGKFLVSGKVFEQICNEHKVLVNWANK